MKNYVFYGFQFAHHGKHSAFLALKEVMKKKNVKVITAKRPAIFWKRGFRRFLKVWMKLQEYKLYRHYKFGSTTILHYFFPENSLFYAPKWKGNNKVVITCHQPVRDGYIRWIENKKPYFVDGIKNADIIILMASNDIEKYRKYAPRAKIVYIPHGINEKYFSCEQIDSHKKRDTGVKHILTVGNWLRDYNFWCDVVKEINKTTTDFRFTVVAGKDAKDKIKKQLNDLDSQNITLLSGISDEELRMQYYTADLLFLPLIDCWANNALLEASSMGLPVMATDLPATREYLTDELGIFFKNDSAEDTARLLMNVSMDEIYLKKMGKGLRKRIVDEYSWNRIADRYISLYDSF